MLRRSATSKSKLLHNVTFSGWRKCEHHVACHSNGELPRVFSTLEWRATLFAGINWKIMMPGSISDFKIDEANKPQK
jgi:hypothetical protein